MTIMEDQPSSAGNQRRAHWRSLCRKRLSQHIREALGVVVKPSEVRLKFGEDQAQYAWKFNDKSLVPLFDKHLSKHSVGAYMQLHREAGKGFCAVDPKEIAKDTPQLDNAEQLLRLERENADLALRLAKAEQRIVALEATRVQHEDMISTQKRIIEEAQASINFYEKDIQKWMLKVDIYEKSTIQCSHALQQTISYLQGAQIDIPTTYT